MISHLHTHSCFSFLEGLCLPGDLVKEAARYEMPAIALTDHLSMTGMVSFYIDCRKAGVKPILGIEVDLRLPYSLSAIQKDELTGQIVLLAKDLEGWRNLSRLSSLLATTGENGESRSCTFDDLAHYSNGLVCLTGGCRGPIQRLSEIPYSNESIQQLTGSLIDIYPDSLYIELHRSQRDEKADQQLLSTAASFHLPVIAANPIYYLSASQAVYQKTAASIRTNIPISQLPDAMIAPAGSYFLSPQEMNSKYNDLPETLSTIEEVVAMCNLELPIGKPNYPSISQPEGILAIDVLRQKAEAGAEKLYGSLTAEIRSRLETELVTIASCGYEPIFLIAEEMVSFARINGIPYASRGSASSSLVAHCIGITTPDPLQLDLYFERFLNPARTTPPDIDTDFCSRKRNLVIEHLFDTYGRSQVAMVGTVNTFRSRSALGDVAKAFNLPPSEVRSLTSRLHHRYFGPALNETMEDGKKNHPFAVLINEYRGNSKYQEIFEHAAFFLGLPKHLSVHPGGVVIAPGEIADFVPVARSGGKGVVITQLDLGDVERLGLVKLDLLGIRGLTVLGDLVDIIFSWRRKEFSSPSDVLETIPTDDEETARLVSSGQTIGCFQIESPGMRATLKDIQAKTPADIMAALALYRPGPLKGGLRDAFVRRFKHQEAVTHIHPALSGLLSETYGVILYQEQVLRIAHKLAGFSPAEADLLRRGMSHFDPGKQMKLLEEKFISGVEKYSSIPPETGKRIWDMMAAFAGYGFPKAHAASYAQVAWRSAWCKTHYTPEFLASVLANWGGYYPQSVYLNEARRLKIKVLPPHVNHSDHQFSVVYPQGEPVLYMGLDQLRDLTHRTQTRILHNRPFRTLDDFILRVDPRKIELEYLIQVSALDGFGTIPALLRKISSTTIHPGQLSFFMDELDEIEDWSVDQKNSAQKKLLGISITGHPLERFAHQITQSGAITTVEAITKIGETVRVAGIRQTLFRSQTEQGKWMGFLALEDLEGMIDVHLLPDIYQRYRNVLASSDSPILVDGVIEIDPGSGDLFLRAQKIMRVI